MSPLAEVCNSKCLLSLGSRLIWRERVKETPRACARSGASGPTLASFGRLSRPLAESSRVALRELASRSRYRSGPRHILLASPSTMAFPSPLALGHEPDDGTALARLNRRGVRFANKQAVRAREQHEHGTVLHRRRRRDRDTIGTGR